MTEEATTESALELATKLTIAWLGNSNTRASAAEVPTFLRSMHAAVGELASAQASAGESAANAEPAHVPAVSVRKSLSSQDHIISLIDGKPYKTLRRHLSTHGLTPEEYRQRYGLKADYPMVAPTYSEHRRAMAQKIGLGARGRKAKTKDSSPEAPAAPPASVKASVAKTAPAKTAPAKAPAAKTAAERAPVAKAPAAKAPVAKASAEKAPATKVPTVKASAAKASAAKASAEKSAVVQAPAEKPTKAKRAPRRKARSAEG